MLKANTKIKKNKNTVLHKKYQNPSINAQKNRKGNVNIYICFTYVSIQLHVPYSRTYFYDK